MSRITAFVENTDPEDWIRVDVPSKTYQDARSWFAQKKWMPRRDYMIDSFVAEGERVTFVFSDSTKATLFKLTWA